MTSSTPTPDPGELRPAPSAPPAPTAPTGRSAPVVPPVPDAPGYGARAAEPSAPPSPTGGGPPVAPVTPVGLSGSTGPGSPGGPRGRNTLAWWGFGLSFGSVLASVAGAALALSVVGIVVARRTGRALVPAIVGCAIAGLALGAHAAYSTVRGVERVASLVQDAADPAGSDGSSGSDGSGGADAGPTFTDVENDYLDTLADSPSDTYAVYTDPALVEFGHQACDALDGGEDADAAAQDLDMGRAAAAEVVQVATQVLCPAADPSPSGS